MTPILVASIFLEMSYLMIMFFRSIEPYPVVPQPCSRRTMPLICAPCIWVTAELIWRMIICIYLCLLTLLMQKVWCPHQLQDFRRIIPVLLRESASVVPPMIGASDPPPADDIPASPLALLRIKLALISIC